ncbi:hypothetical protein [Labedaea rhizosphaerae]|uniref:hypothetical protein n=1 Tax=Labedaea rhizosphaerae TaxID=598644 RepID=UPI0031334880
MPSTLEPRQPLEAGRKPICGQPTACGQLADRQEAADAVEVVEVVEVVEEEDDEADDDSVDFFEEEEDVDESLEEVVEDSDLPLPVRLSVR